ncbi:MAG: aldo/keto reductase [Alphaproteobacteria bacterium]|nr:aldo/keto reductase [Alphaproteobacteria bacterium]
MVAIPSYKLPSGAAMPAFGLGTWRMGENRGRRAEEVAALRLGLDLGVTLIDTAEMYGEGAAEEILAEAIAGARDRVFIVSKVYPHNAGKRAAIEACERSLKRLRTDRIDVYLLHWPGSAPVAETLEAFEQLRRDGKIRDHGVSNLDTSDMEEWRAAPGGERVATNQILYNLSRRGPEHELIPWCRRHKIPVMAYSPVDQGRILKNAALKRVADRLGATPAQVALAWLLGRDGIVVIPKAVKPDHVREDVAALDLKLGAGDLAELDKAFPPPKGASRLEML